MYMFIQNFVKLNATVRDYYRVKREKKLSV